MADGPEFFSVTDAPAIAAMIGISANTASSNQKDFFTTRLLVD
jgi:hypothetical protein